MVWYYNDELLDSEMDSIIEQHEQYSDDDIEHHEQYDDMEHLSREHHEHLPGEHNEEEHTSSALKFMFRDEEGDDEYEEVVVKYHHKELEDYDDYLNVQHFEDAKYRKDLFYKGRFRGKRESASGEEKSNNIDNGSVMADFNIKRTVKSGAENVEIENTSNKIKLLKIKERNSTNNIDRSSAQNICTNSSCNKNSLTRSNSIVGKAVSKTKEISRENKDIEVGANSESIPSKLQFIDNHRSKFEFSLNTNLSIPEHKNENSFHLIKKRSSFSNYASYSRASSFDSLETSNYKKLSRHSKKDTHGHQASSVFKTSPLKTKKTSHIQKLEKVPRNSPGKLSRSSQQTPEMSPGGKKKKAGPVLLTSTFRNTVKLGPFSRADLKSVLKCKAFNSNLTSPITAAFTIDMNREYRV